ncbi:hypothetical protein [Pelovirga terrestris]|uniref:Uncharacterized protein n=1 Tax=Pelovirga terrestris TaxID=2771352 RepID=A0A8J6QVM6_9BACT|nr:hypothetical protein [Pelovirga terrestris]MBD1401900.1 hypothetical protein [Pelovirga terrestris]
MNIANLDQELMKSVLKESVKESLFENRAFFEDIFAEILHDVALTEAIEQGRQTPVVDYEDVRTILEG